MIKISFAGFALLSLIACKGWDDVPPSAIKPSPDLPCGNIGVECAGPDGGFNHTCCWQGEVCGSGWGCPENACCDDRPFDPASSSRASDAGARHPMFRSRP